MSEPVLPWLKPKGDLMLIAGPCSVESEDQMMETAQRLSEQGHVSAFRGGIWKPRTKPDSFEGIGAPALKWLKQAGLAFQTPVTTEVANARHVEQALEAEIDFLWIGARTTVNPFFVQEIADALAGTDIPVMVKNPIHPELGLWMGALERLEKVGISQLAAIHRGFYTPQRNPFRNDPKWELMFELRRLVPNLPIICDPSHIAGKRSLIQEVCQSAIDLGLGGFMIESHRQPDKALSDAAQQLTPEDLSAMLNRLERRKEQIDDLRHLEKLEELRGEIDRIDTDLLELLRKRIDVVDRIGAVKDEGHLTIFQMKRWFKILEQRKAHGKALHLDENIIHELFQLIHKYSIDTQIKRSTTDSGS